MADPGLLEVKSMVGLLSLFLAVAESAIAVYARLFESIIVFYLADVLALKDSLLSLFYFPSITLSSF